MSDAQKPGKASSLGMSVRVSPEEVGLGISPVCLRIIPSLKHLNRTKRWKQVSLLSLLSLPPSHTSVHVCLSSPTRDRTCAPLPWNHGALITAWSHGALITAVESRCPNP